MGFFRRLLGLEVKPGEPMPLTDAAAGDIDWTDGRLRIIYFFSLWCSSCQVMGGLLNEIGPDYSDRVEFYKIDVGKNPRFPGKFEIKSVPAVVALKGDRVIDRQSGLAPIDILRAWIEAVIGDEKED